MYALRASRAFDASPGVHFIRIASSRSRIEPHEPTVGFTIVTDRPFAEVFVTSSLELFQPGQASRRTPANWYASRAHGLLRGPGELAYMLPAAFVASAVKAEPRAKRLYFLAASYTSEAASDPVWSMREEQWATSLPYLEIAQDVNANAIASTLGVALSRLSRSIGFSADANGANAATTFGTAFSAAAAVPARSVVWRHETTGLIGTPRFVGRVEALVDGGSSSESAHVESDREEGEKGREPAEGEPPNESVASHANRSSTSARTGCGSNGRSEGRGVDVPYDDGHGPGGNGTYGLDSTYPTGAEKPDDLPDGEDGGYGDEASWQASADELHPTDDAAVPRAFDHILDELARTRSGRLYDVARATYEDGLAFGLLQATQRSGELGRLLGKLQAADRATFERIFGAAAQELLEVTTAEAEEKRMRPVSGKALTDEPWRWTFVEAGRDHGFVEVQRVYARQRMLEPLLPIARDLGLGSAKGLAVLACVLVGKSLQAGMRWILAGISPVTTPAQLALALPALRQPNLAAFQQAEGLRPSGELDVATQARITRKLRELEASSSVPVLTPAQMIQTLARQASGEPFQAKLESLVANTELSMLDI